MVGHPKLQLAVFVVFLAVFVAIAAFVVTQIVSNQPPKAPAGQNFPALNTQNLNPSP